MWRYLVAITAVPALLWLWLAVERVAARGRPPGAARNCAACALKASCRRR